MVRDVSRNAEIWVADVGKVLSKQGRTKADLGGLLVVDAWSTKVQGSGPFVRQCSPRQGSKVSGSRCPEGGGLGKIFLVMVRFLWNGVVLRGMRSKLHTQQEQDTLLDGGT